MPSSNQYKRQLQMENPHQQSMLEKKIRGKNPYKLLFSNRTLAKNPNQVSGNTYNVLQQQIQKRNQDYLRQKQRHQAVVKEIKKSKYKRLFNRF